jgi:hypothetical protein
MVPGASAGDEVDGVSARGVQRLCGRRMRRRNARGIPEGRNEGKGSSLTREDLESSPENETVVKKLKEGCKNQVEGVCAGP